MERIWCTAEEAANCDSPRPAAQLAYVTAHAHVAVCFPLRRLSSEQDGDVPDLRPVVRWTEEFRL